MNRSSERRFGLAGGWLDPALANTFSQEKTDAHRCYSSDSAWIERYGSDFLLSYKDEALLPTLLEPLAAWCAGAAVACRRLYGRYLPTQNQERLAPVLLQGDAALPAETTVQERGLRYGIDFSAGYSAGLFMDQRANRSAVRRLAPKRLLNTFAYTCSFSVAAASVGAETVSIDLSRKSLDRGKENFALNTLDPARHRFLADDVLDVLPRLERRGEKFDCIILDPPTFSRGNKGRRFQVEEDLENLLRAALEVAAPGAHVLLSTNCTRLNLPELESIARFSCKTARRSAAFHREPGLPDIPPELAARTIWLSVK